MQRVLFIPRQHRKMETTFVFRVVVVAAFTGPKGYTTMATGPNLCSRYHSCIDCIQDPCSRNGRNSNSDACAFCTDTNSCIRNDQAVSVCLRDNTKINFCAVSTRLSTKERQLDKHCVINSPYFLVNLGYR
jgi:hypothetical protein